LLQGPSGVGKWLTALSYAEEHGGAAITLRDGPTVEQAREMARLFQQRPIHGRSTIALVDLDECSEQVQNVLLKTLEELPQWGKVLLVASRRPLPTISSRCQVIEFTPLQELEVSDIMVELGTSPGESAYLAMMAAGSVERALRFRDAIREKPVVLSYLDAVARVDRVALATLIPRWSDDAADMLWRWVAEVLMDWPRVFTKAELGVVHKIGVARFYVMVDLLREHLSVDLIAMQLWKMK
jgi:hypothetical protein